VIGRRIAFAAAAVVAVALVLVATTEAGAGDLAGLTFGLSMIAALAWAFGWALWLRPLLDAWRADRWGWVLTIMALGWLGGALYVIAHPKGEATT
jgi:hypothetical protein